MEKKKMEPNIRFKGFTGKWKEKKLGEVANFSKGQGYSKGDLRKEGTPVILYGMLYTKYETVLSNIDTFVLAKNKSIYSKGNEVIVPASGETAEDIARASVVTINGVILGGDLNIIHPKHIINPVFLALTISNGKQQKELSMRAQGKSVVHIHNSDLQDVNLVYPKISEQRRIGTLFSSLDRLLTLHRRELTKLQNIKKALMEKMFPKEGERVPEVRFKEFTGEWEEKNGTKYPIQRVYGEMEGKEVGRSS
jgi:type I restriction enzyme S subunit